MEHMLFPNIVVVVLFQGLFYDAGKENNMDKSSLRRSMITKRKNIDPSTRNEWDRQIYLQVISSEFYMHSNVIFTYVSYNGEVDTHKIIEKALNDKKTVCVPRVISKSEGMEAVPIKSFDDLVSGAYGILEPPKDALTISPERIDMALVPGVAFSSGGSRLGYGGGFYDRYLPKFRQDACIAALAYSIQLIDAIPMEPQDIKVSMIFTNK